MSFLKQTGFTVTRDFHIVLCNNIPQFFKIKIVS